VNDTELVLHVSGLALNVMSTNSPEFNLLLPLFGWAVRAPVPGSKDRVQALPFEALTLTGLVVALNAEGTVMRTRPMAIVLEAVQGAATGVPQFFTRSVHVPDTPPVAVFGVMVAVNCLTAAFAPLTPGAATRAPTRSKAVATKTSLPRLESNGLSTDMSCPFFLAGHRTRMTLLPRKLAQEFRTDMISKPSPLNWGQGRVGQMADIVNV
jgi:hypothetical protein